MHTDSTALCSVLVPTSRCAANRTWAPPLLPTSVSTWIAYLSLVGSVCYLIGSLQVPERLANDMSYGIPELVPGWPMLFVG